MRVNKTKLNKIINRKADKAAFTWTEVDINTHYFFVFLYSKLFMSKSKPNKSQRKFIARHEAKIDNELPF